MKTVTLNNLFHVGTMNPADKWIRGLSHEGAGISVSSVPEVWRSLARLGDCPLWRCEKRGHQFLDAHSMQPEEKSHVYIWARDEKFVEPVPLWELTYFDDELNAPVHSLYPTKAEALSEADEGAEVTETLGWKGTSTFVQRLNAPREVPAILLFDILLTFLAEDAGLDGVFWDDELDPFRYSAPRAVIALPCINSWNFKKVMDTDS